MLRTLCVIATASLVWTSAGLLYSGEGTSPRAILDKAIKAHGGEANLGKFPAVTSKGSGKFYGLSEEGFPYTGEWSFQGLSQQSFLIETKVANMTFRTHRVVNGDKGWTKQNDEAAKEMEKDELAEEKEKIHAGRVASLAPLKDKSYTLDVIGEAMVAEKPAIGIRVSKKGHRDISLYFDKQNGMLVKTETQVKDFQFGGEEYMQTTFYQQYKQIKGVQFATKLLIHKDGKRYIDVEITETHPLEKVDSSVFQRP